MSDLSDVTIGTTAFLRPGYLVESIRWLAKYLPECQMLIADDGDGSTPPGLDWLAVSLDPLRVGDPMPKLTEFQRTVSIPRIRLPFDAGLSRKRNALVRACSTKYFLLWTDDFRADEECRDGVLRLVEVLDQFSFIALAAGRVNRMQYEASLDYCAGSHIRESRVDLGRGWDQQLTCNGRPAFQPVDLAVNYFLAHADVLRQFPWPEEMKIGGEHVCLFLDLKLAEKRVVSVAGVNVKTMTLGPADKDPRYDSFRARAFELGHQAMKRRYNIKTYYGMAGDVS